MLAKVGLGVVAVVVVLLVVITTQPATFRIQRSATIDAPAEVIFAQLNDFHRWSTWNPFEKSDPSVKTTYEGAASGVGSSYHYVGDKVGEGRMTLTESIPYERIAVKAEFIEPFATTNDVEFTLEPVANGVSVTWAMSGDNTFIGKTMSLFLDMDRMLGTEFEKGLADLKLVSEKAAQHRAEATEKTDAAPVVAAKE